MLQDNDIHRDVNGIRDKTCQWLEEHWALWALGRERADTAHETEVILENHHTQRGGQLETVEQEWGATP